MTIKHNDDAFATMLLMSQITPDREELVRPLTSGEWHALSARIREAGMNGMGDLMGLDMSGIMIRLNASEQEAYRLCVLLTRVLPLSMALEKFYMSGIDVVTYDERAYPARLRDRLALKAPAMIYLSGRSELFMHDAVAILGALPAKGDAGRALRALVRRAVSAGYVIVTDGATGLARIAEDEASLAGGRVVEVVADALTQRVAQHDMLGMIELGSAAAMSVVHPDAPYTHAHAISRNKCVYALCHAAFVFAVEQKKGAAWDGACEALSRKYCDAIYAYDVDDYPGNRALIARGATPFRDITDEAFTNLTRTWNSRAARQLSMFDEASASP